MLPTVHGQNGGGHDVSHKYGFGAVDAGAAVSVAENWTNVGEELNRPMDPIRRVPTSLTIQLLGQNSPQ